MAGRPRKTPANPGRASIDLGGIAGAFGVGDVGVEEVPMEGDVDAKMASGSEPLTTLRAEKPSFFENLMTRGASNQKYRDLDAQLKMQQMQQRFQAGQQTAADVAALNRLQEQIRLENEAKIAAEQRARGYSAEDRTRKTGAMNIALNEINLIRMQQGLPPIGRVSDFEGVQIAFGEGNIAQRGVVPALTTLIPEGQEAMIRGNQAASILDYQRQRPEMPGLAYGAELQSTIDRPALAQRGAALSERAQTETEAARRTRDIATARQQNLAQQQLEFERGLPRPLGGGLVALPQVGMSYNLNAFQEGQLPQPSIVTDEQGNRTFGTTPAVAPSLRPLSTGGKRPVGTVDPSLLQGVAQPAGNPAPQPAAPISQPLSSTQQPTITPDEYFRRLNATPDYPNMTPVMQQIAASNRTPQDKQSLLMPLAQQQQAMYQRELEARRRQQQGLRPTLGQVLGF